MTKETPTYFFSYARKDSEFVLKLAKELRVSGAKVWIDQLDILGGQRWDQAVENALQSCQGIIVVLSPTSVISNNVMDEVSYALGESKLVVPVLLSNCEIPFRLRRLHHIDFSKDYQAGFANLLRALSIQENPARALEKSYDVKPTEESRSAAEHRTIEAPLEVATEGNEYDVSSQAPAKTGGRRALDPRIRGALIGFASGVVGTILLVGILFFWPVFLSPEHAETSAEISARKGEGVSTQLIVLLAAKWAIAGAIIGGNRQRLKYAAAGVVVFLTFFIGILLPVNRLMIPSFLGYFSDPGLGAIIGAGVGAMLETARKK